MLKEITTRNKILFRSSTQTMLSQPSKEVELNIRSMTRRDLMAISNLLKRYGKVDLSSSISSILDEAEPKIEYPIANNDQDVYIVYEACYSLISVSQFMQQLIKELYKVQ